MRGLPVLGLCPQRPDRYGKDQSTTQVEAIGPMANDLHEGMPSTDLRMIQNQISRRGPAKNGKGAVKSMLNRFMPVAMPDEKTERSRSARCAPEMLETSV